MNYCIILYYSQHCVKLKELHFPVQNTAGYTYASTHCLHICICMYIHTVHSICICMYNYTQLHSYT